MRMTKHRNILERGRIPKEQEIVNFEIEIGTRLPEPYREFLLTINAKYIAESYYQVNGTKYELHGFVTFGCGDWTLKQHYENLKEHLENRYLAFAYDSGGWQYVISIEHTGNYGKIYFCRMDKALENATTLIANSFDEFMCGLQKDPNF